MVYRIPVVIVAFVFSIHAFQLKGEVFRVDSQSSFNSALNSAGNGDSIIWEQGVFSDIFMDIDESNLYIGALLKGGTVFEGESMVEIRGDNITLEGFQWVGGDIGDEDVINCYGSHVTFSQLNVRAYTSYKYLRIRESCQYNVVIHCNFENRLNLDDQNILSILVDANQPGYHKIQYCSFKNFDGTGNDLGIEPIRIGLSTQADRESRSLVEYCYFTRCDGDGELISSKASQNVYRFNTFEGNSKAELVLRHGSEGVVYGNFFLDGKGGVRVREGQDHYIYNNYFYEIDDRPIYLQNEESDPIGNIHIAFNTVLDSDEIILGGYSGDHPPFNVTLANNIFGDPDDALFEDATGEETWIGNLSSGSLGIITPSEGITQTNLFMMENDAGFFGLSEDSPAINAAQSGYAELPQFEGMDPIDTDLLFDLMGGERPSSIADKDVGCSEFPHEILIQPIATEENTGPVYNTDVVNSVSDDLVKVRDLATISPNPVSDTFLLNFLTTEQGILFVNIYDASGRLIKKLINGISAHNHPELRVEVSDLSHGNYMLKVDLMSKDKTSIETQTLQFVKH